MKQLPRFQEVVLPILREALPDVEITSWIPDIDYRKYPTINVRRLGGVRNRRNPSMMDHPVMELTVYHDEGLPEAEELYSRALEALFDARKSQKLVDSGYITSVNEIMGQTQFSSLFQDSYRVQGLIELGIRPSREDY